jgi:hypothetical protein
MKPDIVDFIGFLVGFLLWERAQILQGITACKTKAQCLTSLLRRNNHHDFHVNQPWSHTVNYATPSVQSEPPLRGSMPIDINREDAVDFWVSEWGCSEFELRVAVAQVGPVAADVGAALGRSV